MDPEHADTQLYHPLDAAKQEIRLLRPTWNVEGDGDPILQYTLDIFGKDDLPEYHTLSYEWSPKLDEAEHGNISREVLVNGHKITVGLNLALFLNAIPSLPQLGDPGSEEGGFRPIWIDAICINQSDNNEKAQQVLLMYSIYSESSGLFIWLGPLAAESDIAMRFVRTFTDKAMEGKGDDWSISTKYTLSKLKSPDNQAALMGLADLLERSYWTRGWIVQEIFAADWYDKEATVLCGKEAFGIINLMYILYNLNDATERLGGRNGRIDSARNWFSGRKLETALAHEANKRLSEAESRVLDLLSIRTPRAKMVTPNLFPCLLRARRSITGDPRDKIFSVLGIVELPENPVLRIDYNAKWETVFHNAAKYIIGSSKDLNILVSAGLNNTILPSWVPNWLDPLKDHVVGDGEPFLAPRHQQCGELVTPLYGSGGRTASAAKEVKLRGQCLTVPAIKLCEISEVFYGSEHRLDASAIIKRIKEMVVFLLDGKSGSGFKSDLRMKGASDIQTTRVLLNIVTTLHDNPRAFRLKRNAGRDWINFCRHCYTGKARASDLSEQQVDDINYALLQHRSLFKYHIPKKLYEDEATEVRDWASTLLQPKNWESQWSEFYAVYPWNNNSLWEKPLRPPTIGVCRVRPQPGDLLYIVKGCECPLLMRPAGEETEKLQIVGAAFVIGIMCGEAYNVLRGAESRITIV